MQMIMHNKDDVYFDVVPFSCFVNVSFAKDFILELGKEVIVVFCLPVYVPKIHSNLMTIMFQFNVYKFHFCCLSTTKVTINMIAKKTLSVPIFSLHTFFILKIVEKTYGGKQCNSSTG